jgi:type IV pilus assembly protein PilM
MKLGDLLTNGSGAAVGLDIGSHSVKVAQISKKGGKHVLTNFGIGKLLPEAIVDGEVMDRDIVVDTIRDLFESKSIKADSVATAVSGRAVIVKKIFVDKLPPEEAGEAIYLEAEQHIPFGIDDVYLDYQVMRDEDPKNPDKMEVLLVAAKRDMVDSHAALIRDAGLTPRVVDVDSFAVQNAYEANYVHGEEEAVLLMNVGASVSNLNIVRNGIPLFTRDISIAGNTFVDQVQRRLNYDRDKSLAILFGADDEKPAEIEEIIAGICEDLSVGIERSLSFLKTSGEGEKIDRIIMTGGGARIPGLLSILADRHGVPVEVGNALSRIGYVDGLFDGEEFDAVAPTLMVAVGLALRTR